MLTANQISLLPLAQIIPVLGLLILGFIFLTVVLYFILKLQKKDKSFKKLLLVSGITTITFIIPPLGIASMLCSPKIIWNYEWKESIKTGGIWLISSAIIMSILIAIFFIFFFPDQI